MPLPSFPIAGTLFDLLGNVSAGEIVGNGFGGATPATVTFTSNVATNQFVKWAGVLYRVDEVVATVGSDGSITRSGNPVLLLANDPGLSVEGLQWQVHVSGMKRFWFDAPTDGVTLDLASVVPAVGVAAVGLASLPVSGLSNATAFMKSVLIGGVDAATVRGELGIGGGNDWEPFANFAAFPATGNTLLEYVAQDTGKLYRWNGSAYIQVADKNAVGLGNVDNTSDASKPVSTAQQAALDLKAPLVSGTFPWPQGLVALWDFQHDDAGGTTVTSRVGAQATTLTARGSKTVVKDAADPGPFGPSLVLDGATAFVKDGNLGALDMSTIGDELSMIVWVKESIAHDEGNAFTERFRAGSHCEAGLEGSAQPARQYGDYFDAELFLGECGHFTPHVEAQDGPSPGYPWSHDHAASHRKYYTGTGVNRWHMEAFTFDGSDIIAYVDGMSDVWANVTEPPPSTWGATVLPGYAAQTVDRNPYHQKKGLNRSATTKRFSIGGVVFGYPPNFDAGNFTTGKLGGVAVFNKALKPEDIMQIRLATLLPGEPITMFSFEVSALGQRPLDEIGWTAKANAANNDVSLGVGNDYRVSRASTATKASLRKSTTAIGACWGPVTGLNSGQVKRLRFKMLSDATTSAAQRLLVKVGSQWWASNTTYAMAAPAASTTDWSVAETKTHVVDWDIGNWLAVTMADTGSTTTFQNLAKNPALTVDASNWAVSSQSPHATGARVSDGAGGFVYRLTWTGTDAHGSGAGTGGTGSLLNTGVAAVTAGTSYSVSMVAKPSKDQHLTLEMYWYNGSGTFISADTSVTVLAVPAGVATTLTMSATAPAGAVGLAVRVVSSVFGGVDWLSGDTLDLSKAFVIAGTSPGYFDGSSAGATWDGTTGLSTSSKTVASGVLSVGAANAAFIDNALVTAVGFLSSGGDGSIVRVTDLELLPTG